MNVFVISTVDWTTGLCSPIKIFSCYTRAIEWIITEENGLGIEDPDQYDEAFKEIMETGVLDEMNHCIKNSYSVKALPIES
tara:strand:+ start:19138 stop:19380 length:243 start_codon:yes stop_codon:yes gene_type:complete